MLQELVAQAEKAGVRVDARVGVWFYLQQSSSFEKLPGRNCSDPDVNVKRKYKILLMICDMPTEIPPNTNIFSKQCNFTTYANI